jgi:hypothetical protein
MENDVNERNKEQKILQMLNEIFPTPPSPTPAKLSPLQQQIVDATFELELLDELPTIVHENELPRAHGCVDFYTYNEITIRLAPLCTWNKDFMGIEPKNDDQLASTLAHEIGHLVHMKQGVFVTSENFIACENLADKVRVQLLQHVGREDLFRR